MLSFVFLICAYHVLIFFFFFNDTATTEIYTLSLHDALPICRARSGPVGCGWVDRLRTNRRARARGPPRVAATWSEAVPQADRLDRRRPVRSPFQRARCGAPHAAACLHRARAPPARAARLVGLP